MSLRFAKQDLDRGFADAGRASNDGDEVHLTFFGVGRSSSGGKVEGGR